MIVSIMQPAYLPWLGFFDRIHRSDIFIVLDHVTADINTKTQFVNRNKIRTSSGSIWLSVPLKASSGKLLNHIQISQHINWQKKHEQSIIQNYRKAPFFDKYFEFIKPAFHQNFTTLLELNNFLMLSLLEALGLKKIDQKIFYSSKLPVTGKKDDLVLNLCKHFGATTYISGPFGRDYLDENKFSQNDINIEYHDYKHPTYQQAYQDFEPFMSIIDLLFCKGDQSLKILTNTLENNQVADNTNNSL